jgi:CheY-like chemotaxis protein
MFKNAKILVATDMISDGNLVRKLLEEEFDNIKVSSIQNNHVNDFDSFRPEVIVLAFEDLEKSERYYLSLYRLSEVIHTYPHRTLVLCNKDELKQVYQLCKNEQFDDYVLFWPLVHDTPRLPMSVIQALKSLRLAQEGNPSLREFAPQVRDVSMLGDKIKEYSKDGNKYFSDVESSIKQAHLSIKSAIDVFSTKLSDGEINGINEIKDEIQKLKSNSVESSFETAIKSIEPTNKWINSVDDLLYPQSKSLNDLKNAVKEIKPVILIVDDDLIQIKIFQKMFFDVNYEIIFAKSGLECLKAIAINKPDLILMDIHLPDLSGIEITKRIRKTDGLEKTPIVMITGDSEKSIVIDSIKNGANGFVVKPFDKETIILKINSLLN